MRFASSAAALIAAAACVAAAPSAPLDRVFSAAGEPARLHYQVLFVSGGAVHRMEVWRDGDRRVKRATDAALITVATHRPGDPAFQMTVFDRRRRIATTLDRDSLYRVGNFTDWFDLGHGLRHPQGAYTLAAGRAPAAPLPASAAPCRWYDLTQAGQVVHICWDVAHRLPQLIIAWDRPVWRVVAFDERPFPPTVFAVDARGYVRNNAGRDIKDD